MRKLKKLSILAALAAIDDGQRLLPRLQLERRKLVLEVERCDGVPRAARAERPGCESGDCDRENSAEDEPPMPDHPTTPQF